MSQPSITISMPRGTATSATARHQGRKYSVHLPIHDYVAPANNGLPNEINQMSIVDPNAITAVVRDMNREEKAAPPTPMTPGFQPSWITSEEIAKMGVLPYLTGLRAVASIAIQIYHIAKPDTRAVGYFGSIALSIHFVQGGFLITGALLYLQKANKGKPFFLQYSHLPRFFSSRWVRLYPALMVMIILTSIWWQMRHDMAVHLAKMIFRTTFKIQHTKILDVPGKPPNPFSHTWFLDVQEAFYLFWALTLPYMVMLGAVPRLVILIGMFAYSLRVRMKVDRFNATLPINLFKMVAGAALQLVPIPRALVQQHSRSAAAIIMAVIVLWGSSTFFEENFSKKMHRVHGDLAGVILTFAITMAAMSRPGRPKGSLTSKAPSPVLPPSPSFEDQNRHPIFDYLPKDLDLNPIEILNFHWLEFIGRISYAWYIWQIPIMHYEDTYMGGYKGIGTTAEAFIVAMASTFWMEEPIRNWYQARVKRARSATASMKAANSK